jgi:hypothetical protein
VDREAREAGGSRGHGGRGRGSGGAAGGEEARVFSRGRKAWCVGGEATGAEEFYVPSLFSTSFFLVVEMIILHRLLMWIRSSHVDAGYVQAT